MKHILVAVLLVGVLTTASGVVYARTYQLFTLTGFVEELIARNIVPAGLAGKARDLAARIERVEAVEEKGDAGVQNADKVSTKASQLIEYGSLEYTEGEDIKGLLFVVKNETDEYVILDAVRQCQILYRIYTAEDELVYDSSTLASCVKNEKVTWELPPRDSRMFPVSHPITRATLSKGTYRVEMEYPGYGKGERTITVK